MTTDTTPALTDDEPAMSELERSWFTYAGAKEAAIVERFGVSASVHYLRLNALIDRPDALAADPMTVRRLQRMRDARRRLRSERARLG
jgi:hypothetical protein